MKLSFIVPVYNARLYLSRCLDSLLDQSINDFEIICINDGSTDDSLDILREYEKKFPEIIKVLTQKNHGIGPTRNTALKIVSGKYTWFIDNDDCIQKDCLSPLIKVFDETDADIINIKYLHGFYETNPLNQDINGQFNYEKISQEFAMYFYWDAPWSKIYKTEFLKENGAAFSDVFGEDTSITFDLYSKTTSIYSVDKYLYAWFERPDSYSHNITSSKHYDTFPILLETLQKQSEECSARLKPFYENLILRKIYDFYPRFINSQVDISVEQSRELCLKKMSIMEKSIPQNLYFEICRREQAERNAFLNHQKQIRQGYESSVSWKITNPLRLIKKILKKEENKPTKLEIKSGISSVIESFEF